MIFTEEIQTVDMPESNHWRVEVYSYIYKKNELCFTVVQKLHFCNDFKVYCICFILCRQSGQGTVPIKHFHTCIT